MTASGTPTLVLLGLSLALSPPAGASNGPVKADVGISLDAAALVRALFAPPPDLGPTVKRLRSARDGATENERRFFDRVLLLLEGLQKEPDELQKKFPDFVQVVRDLGDLYPENFDVQRQVAGAFLPLLQAASSFGFDQASIRAEMLARAKKLVADFPDRGRSYGILARALGETGADAATLLGAYKKCVQLDSSADYCRQSHQALIQELQAPRCTGAGISRQLELYGAAEVPVGAPGEGRRIKSHGSTLELEAQACTTASELLSISLSESQDKTLNIQFSPSGAIKLKSATDRLARFRGWMVFMLGDEPVFSAPVNEQIGNGRLQAYVAEESPMDLLLRLCIKIERPTVPADLKL